MYDNIIQSLLDKAKNMNVDVVWDNHFSSYTPPASSTKYNRIVMNTNWHKPNEFIFQLAHELAHIQNHDECDIAFYHASYSSHERIEHEANLGAIKLLLQIYRDMECEMNSVTFMKLFSIPGYLFDNVVKMMKKKN